MSGKKQSKSSNFDRNPTTLSQWKQQNILRPKFLLTKMYINRISVTVIIINQTIK